VQRTLVLVALITCLLMAPHFALGACDLNATTSNFASQLAAAQPGQTLCLAAGNYGNFAGVTKTSPGVTITAASGATPTLTLEIRQTSPVAAWLILDHLTIQGGEISAPAHDLTFQNDTFTDKLNIWQNAGNSACSNCPAMNNSNIVFNNDLFNMANNQSGSGGFEGRINLVNAGNNDPSPAGVTIKNSKFTTGCADGIQVASGGRGVTIGPGNEFFNLSQGSCGPHVDSIQFVGSDSPGPIITGNYFHGNATGIVAYDYSNSATVTNNVITNITQDSMLLAGFNNVSVVEHNTVVGDSIICGYTHEGNACQAAIRNNITGGFEVGGTTIGGSTGSNPSFFDYNLCTAGLCSLGSISAGAHSLSGRPTYVGGTSPTTYAGFALTSSSIGSNSASDGTDIGMATTNNTGGGSTPPAAPSNLAAIVQ
jgi:hypothetical protein